MQLKPWELAKYTLRQLFDSYEVWREINVHDKWEQTRMMCFFMGNHKANKPENLFSLEVDNIRLQNLIDSGEASFATIREQTPDERELMRKLNKVK